MNQTDKVLNIICIDDEANVLNSLKRLFHRSNFRLTCTTNPQELFTKIGSEEFAIIVSDQRMPEMEGTEVLRQAKKLSPRSLRIMLTGYADIQAAIRAVNDGHIFRFLTKPWDEQALKAAFQEAADHYNLVREHEQLQKLTEKQNEELKTWNATLEAKVESRTTEIKNLNTELQKSFLESIRVMGSLSSVFDGKQEGHSSRVARVAGGLAKELGLAARDCFQIQVASFLHDVGTIAIRYHVNSPVTAKIEAVKTSARITSLIPGLGSAPIYVLHQAERFDGAGYPNGLTGEGIPLGARIIAAANAYDELLQEFGNEEIASVRKALEGLKLMASAELDPKIVETLAQSIEKSLLTRKEQQEVTKELYELRENMVLSRPLVLPSGVVLLDAGMKLKTEIIERLWQRQVLEQSIGTVHVYANSLPPIPKQDRIRKAA